MLVECSPFEAHVKYGVTPDDFLDEFCCKQGNMFLGAVRLMNQFGTHSLEEGAKSSVKWVNLLQVLCGANNRNIGRRATFKDCPWYWSIVWSYSFCEDFVGYIKYEITV